MVFIFWDKEAFAVEMSRLVLEELEAVGVLNMEDEVEFRVPLGLSVLPPTGGGRGSLRLFFKKLLDQLECIMWLSYTNFIINIYEMIDYFLPEPGMSKG